MNKKNISKAAIMALTFVFVLGLVLPVNAFYMEVPKSLKNIKFYKTENGVTLTQYMAPPPGSGTTQPPPSPPSGSTYTPPPTNGTSQQPPPPPPDQNYQQPNQQQSMPYQGQPERPGSQQYQQQQPYQGQQMGPGEGGQFGPGGCAPGTQCGPGSGRQFNQQGQNFDEGQQGGEQDDQQRKAREAQDLQRMKRDMSRMGSMVTQFERMIAQVEKKGTPVSSEVKDKVAKIKSILEAVKNATSFEELQSAGVEEIQDLMQSLEEFRRDVVEAQQRMDGIKRGLKGMEQGLRMFEQQIARLTKQGIAVPQEVRDNLDKVKTVIAAIKTAKTWEEIEAAGIEDMQDLFQNLDQSRQQLEALARWPQTLKQINMELNRLTSALKRAKSVVASLSKRGVDLSDVYANFEAAVNKLKSVRDDASAKMKAGESEEAFNLLENDFFGQMEDVWENQRVIETMANLGRFASEFKRGIADAKRTIAMLKRKKIDTTELADLVAQAEAKGNEILALMKAKPVDQEAIFAGLQELENLKQAFEEKVDELTGGEDIMPWEKGPQQFQGVSIPGEFGKFIPKKKQAEQGSESEMGPGGTGEGPGGIMGPPGGGGGGIGPGF